MVLVVGLLGVLVPCWGSVAPPPGMGEGVEDIVGYWIEVWDPVG